MKHRLVVIGSSIEFIRILKLARERGIYTICCDGYPDGVAKPYADKSYDINIRDVDAVAQMCIDEKADGIIGSFSDLIFEQITKIADKAGLKWYAKPGMLKYYREKNYTKQILSDHGCYVPKNTILKKGFSEKDLDGFTYPLVLKPVNGYGSKGIFIAHNIEEINNEYASVNQLGTGTIDAIEVEEYSHGREYNMMSWVLDGKVFPISIADREKDPQKGNEIPHLNRVCYPAKNIHHIYREATEVLQCFADAVKQKSGPLSMQFFYNQAHGVEVCEIAGRMFGYEHEMVTLCSGLDIEKVLLDYVYDEKELSDEISSHSIFFNKTVAGLYINGVQGEKIVNMDSLYELAKDPHVIESDIFYQNGDIVDNFGSKPYLVRYYITGRDREEVDQVTRYFFDHLKVMGENNRDILIHPVFEED